MPSPLGHVDAASFFGSWPLTPYFSGATPEVLPGALLDRATLLSARRETSAGFNVSGRSFKILLDDEPAPFTVTFTGTNPLDLDDVISQINSGVLGGYGQDVAFRDNGFLRLRSNIIGGTSYIRIDTDPASSPADVFLELGLFAGLESRGGTLTTSPTVDPDRQVALPGQYSVGYGEDLDYNAINRAVCQLAVNADHAYGQFRRGMAKTTTADLAISSDEVQVIGENVYCGKVTAGTAQDDTAVVLDTSDNEVVVEHETNVNTGAIYLQFWYEPETQKQHVVCTSHSIFDPSHPAGDYYVNPPNGGPFGTCERMKIIEYIAANHVIVMNVSEVDGSEVEVGTEGSPYLTAGGDVTRIDTDRLYITDFLDGPGGSSVIDTAVEIVAATTISRVEWNNRLVCDTATFAATGVKEGDVAVIASHDTSVPFSNNGSYRVSQVIDEKTIELMSLDHGPVILNTLGTLGTVTIQTDTNFFYQPYAKLNFAPPSGTYRVVFKKYASLLDMVDDIDSFATSPTRFVQETSTDIQRVVKAIIGPSATSFNEYLYDDKRNSLENLYFRMNQEHNADGHHPYLYITDTMPETGQVAEKFTIQRDYVDVTSDPWGTAVINADITSMSQNHNAWALECRMWNRDTVGTYKNSWIGGIWVEGRLSGNARTDDIDAISAYLEAEDTSDILQHGCVFRAYPSVKDVGAHIENLYGLRVDDISGVGADQSYGVWIGGASTDALKIVDGRITLEATDNPSALIGPTGYQWTYHGLGYSYEATNASNHQYPVVFTHMTSGATSATLSHYTIDVGAAISNAVSARYVGAIWAEADVAGSGTAEFCEAISGGCNVTAGSTGKIEEASVFRAYGGNIDVGSIDKYYGVRIDDITSGTLENYGVRIAGASGGSTLNRSILVESGTSEYRGRVDIFEGTTTEGHAHAVLDAQKWHSNPASNKTAVVVTNNVTASPNNRSMIGLYAGAEQHVASGTTNYQAGVYGGSYTGAGSAGTVSHGQCFAGDVSHNATATGTFTKASVFFAWEGSAGGGTITDYHGLYVRNLQSGAGKPTNNYGAYFEGASTAAIQVQSGKVRCWTDGADGDSGWVGHHSEFVDTTPATGNRFSHLFETDVVNRTGGGDIGNIIASTNSYAAAGTYNWNPVVWSDYSTQAGTSTATINSVECFGGQINHYGAENLTWAVVYRAYGGPAPTGSGDFTNYAGLYVDSLTRADNNYGVYVAGASPGHSIHVASGVSYFGGNVGIGDQSPIYLLHVATSGDTGIFLEDDSNTSGAPHLRARGRRYDDNNHQGFSGKLVLERYRSERVAVDPPGGDPINTNVSLGAIIWGGNHTNSTESNIAYTSSIQAKAEALWTDVATMPTSLVFYTGSTGRALTYDYTIGEERMRIDSAGRVGVNATPADGQMFVINNSEAAGSPELTLQGNSSHSMGFRCYASPAGSLISNIVQLGDHTLIFSDGGSGSGRLCIGAWNSNQSALVLTAARAHGVNVATPLAAWHVRSNDLGGTAGNSQEVITAQTSSANLDRLRTKHYRHTTGANWDTARWLIQREVDGTSQMGYIGFGSHTNDLLTFGEATTEYMRIDGSGVVGIANTLAVGNTSLLDGSQLNVHGLGAKLLISSSSESVDAILKLADSEALDTQQFSIVYDCSSSPATALAYIGNATGYCVFRQEDAANMSFSPGSHGWNFLGTTYARWASVYARNIYYSQNTNDAGPKLYAVTANSYVQFDDNDYLDFNRTNNDLNFYLNGAVQLFYDSSEDYWRFYADVVPGSGSDLLGTSSIYWGAVYANTHYADEVDDYRAKTAKSITYRVHAAHFQPEDAKNFTYSYSITQGAWQVYTGERVVTSIPIPVNANGTFSITALSVGVESAGSGTVTVVLRKMANADGNPTVVASWAKVSLSDGWHNLGTPDSGSLPETIEQDHSYILDVLYTLNLNSFYFRGITITLSMNAVPAAWSH